MSITRKLTAATAVLAFAATGVASAADAPIVTDQMTSASRYAPVLIPGTGIKKGERLPAGARIIYRDVTLEGKQTVNVTMRAPAGKRMRALAFKEPIQIGFSTTGKGSYYGRKQVKLRTYVAPKATGEVSARVYALVR